VLRTTASRTIADIAKNVSLFIFIFISLKEACQRRLCRDEDEEEDAFPR
jgi:hypothetical protein